MRPLLQDKKAMKTEAIQSGLTCLDYVLQGLRLGDNIVWQVDNLEDYIYFAEHFVTQAIQDHRHCLYIRFALHPPILRSREGLEIIEVNPSPGFDFFCNEVHKIIEKYGKRVFYVFDNLSDLVNEWATDELLANFFQVTCPYLFELDTVAYFALRRGKHSHNAVARIRDTTQILIDVYRVADKMYIHPLKVWDRYSPQMFLPHSISDTHCTPIFHSGEAAALSAMAQRHSLPSLTKSIAPWETVYQKLTEYYEKRIDTTEEQPEMIALEQELSQMLFGNHPQFNKLANHYFTLDDLFNIRNRLIGSGRIGGKAAGMLLARKILLMDEGNINFSELLVNHDSFFIGSDVFFTFLVNNNLFKLRMQISRESNISREEFEQVEQQFLAGKFPPEIMEQFRDMLAYFGQAPIIVRSSSLLEDSFGNSFAGKYRSEFCTNQGSPEERLEVFLRAVKLVYASALNQDAISYRHKRGLIENDEQMAILIQRVSGTSYRNYFFPPLAGVAFSRNLYAWSSRIDPAKGVIRLVFGLGTRAVNRVGGDYPRMISISHPELRPEIGKRIAKYSQWEVDLLDLKANDFVDLSIKEVLENRDYPNLYLFVSLMKDDHIFDPFIPRLEGTKESLILTFNNLIRRTNFIKIFEEILTKLERAYGYPVDTEFTAFVDSSDNVKVDVLQCRPLYVPGSLGSVKMPKKIQRKKILFKSNRVITGGIIQKVKYILYIDPICYSGITDMIIKKTIGRIVGHINQHPRIIEGKIIMMGPGRWGSSNIDLGVNVGFADIHNATVLVEIAREEGGQVPEVSFGTHFFQDLVESRIIYLPLYPDEPQSEFNEEFFQRSPNIFSKIISDYKEVEDIIKVIDVFAITKGAFVNVVADPETQNAVCFIRK